MNFVKKLEIRSWKLEVCGMGLRAMITDHGSRINGKLGSMNNNHGLPLVAGRIDNGRNADLPVTCSLIAVRPQAAACPARPLNTHCPGRSHLSLTARRAAFSLAEILIAIFVLSIGLIMIASVFPVAAKWTAEDAQTSVAQVIAKNAVAQIRTQYLAGGLPLNATAAQPLVGYGPFVYSFGNAHPYQFGTHQAVTGTNYAPFAIDPAPAAPTPAPAAPPGNYYWSAVIVPAAGGYAGMAPSAQLGNVYTVYVFVFSKGDQTNTFAAPAANTGFPNGGSTLLPMQPDPQNSVPSYLSFYPQLFEGEYPYASAAMPMDSLGVDVTTGSVFRLVTDPANNAVVPTGLASGSVINTASDLVIYAPPAIGQTASPLIYVYVTTVNL